MDFYQRVFGIGLNILNKINNNYLTAKVKLIFRNLNNNALK